MVGDSGGNIEFIPGDIEEVEFSDVTVTLQQGFARAGKFERLNTDSVWGEQDAPDIARLTGGEFVVSFENWLRDDRPPNDAKYSLLFLDEDGSKAKPLLTDDLDITPFAENLKVTATTDGGFFVSWADTDSREFVSQKYDSDGVKVGSESSFGYQFSVYLHNGTYEIAPHADGQFGLVFTDNGLPNDGEIYYQSLDAAGVGVGDPTLITRSAASSPEIVPLESGDSYITWAQKGNDPDHTYHILGQQVSSDGDVVGARDVISAQTFEEFPSYGPHIAAVTIDGKAYIAWAPASSNTVYDGVFGERPLFLQSIGSDGSLEGVVEQLTTIPIYLDGFEVDVAPSGEFLLTYRDGDEVVAQQFDANAEPLSPAFSVSEEEQNVFELYDKTPGDGHSDRLIEAARVEDPEYDHTSDVSVFSSQHYVQYTKDDEIYGTSGDDRIFGTESPDRIDGEAGADRMTGYGGNDVYVVDHIDDEVIEADGGGEDLVETTVNYELPAHVENLQATGAGGLTAVGNALSNILRGDAGDNRLEGWGGDDRLEGDGGANVLVGGAGDDIYVVTTAKTQVIESSGEGKDEVYSSLTFELPADVEDLKLTGTAGIDGVGNTLANTIEGNSADNRLEGGGGDDHLDGVGGVNELVGGAGNDTYRLRSINSQIIEQVNGGEDTVETSQSYELGPNLENLALLGSDHVHGTGNDLDNYIKGNQGDNVLDGGSGADVLEGGDGSDIYYVDNINDQVIESIRLYDRDTWIDNNDVIYSSVSSEMPAYVETLYLTGGADLDAIGPEGDTTTKRIFGNDGNNTITLGDRGVAVQAGAGDDLIEGSSRGDSLYGGPGADTLRGNDGRDSLYGGAGPDILDGGAGSDSMSGGAGDDTYYVDSLGDPIYEGSNNGDDEVILDFAEYNFSYEYTAPANIERVDASSISSLLTLKGNASDNELVGGSGGNYLDGHTGNNILTGGLGNDTFVIRSSNDQVNDFYSHDTDQAHVYVDYTLPDNVENAFIYGGNSTTGPQHIQLTGNSQDNYLEAGRGNSTLDGGAGDDILVARSRDDTLTGGSGSDEFRWEKWVIGDDADSDFDDIVTDFQIGVDSLTLPDEPGIGDITYDASGTTITHDTELQFPGLVMHKPNIHFADVHIDSVGNAAPTVGTVSVSRGIYGIGDVVNLTIEEVNGFSGLSFSRLQFNGQELSSFNDNGDGTYSSAYKVAEGDANVVDGGDASAGIAFATADGFAGPGKGVINLVGASIDASRPFFVSTATANIDENFGANEVVYTASATDNAQVTYSLKANNSDDADSFTIDGATGEVTLTEDPDYETKPSYDFTVVAEDAAGNSAEQAVTLGITDVDEVAPSITSPATAFSIAENSGENQVVYTATADDSADVSDGVTFSLKADNS
ncbi:cadherin domain-containing protein, partial [Spiribacter pallidus]|uniref:cadherin domain-containing protein n=1 Tax=Spiribacter pallidus TaxID=1987936 RepID=UPI00349FAC03